MIQVNIPLGVIAWPSYSLILSAIQSDILPLLDYSPKVSFTIILITNSTHSSQVVGRRPQGILQGYFASAGSLARMIFPISSGYMMHLCGPTVLFCILIAIIAFTISFSMYYKKTLEKLSS